MSDLVLRQPQEARPIRYVGLIARVDLLPKEVRQQAAVKAARRLALLFVVLALAIVAAAYVGVSSLALSAQLQLSSAQARTNELNQRQGEYQSVRALEKLVGTADAAARVGTATAIDWTELVGRITGPMPGGAVVQSASIVTQSPITAVAPATSPIATARIGQIQLSAFGADLTALSDWLDVLRADPTFSSIEVASATQGDGWLVTLTASISPSLTALTGETEEAEG